MPPEADLEFALREFGRVLDLEGVVVAPDACTVARAGARRTLAAEVFFEDIARVTNGHGARIAWIRGRPDGFVCRVEQDPEPLFGLRAGLRELASVAVPPFVTPPQDLRLRVAIRLPGRIVTTTGTRLDERTFGIETDAVALFQTAERKRLSEIVLSATCSGPVEGIESEVAAFRGRMGTAVEAARTKLLEETLERARALARNLQAAGPDPVPPDAAAASAPGAPAPARGVEFTLALRTQELPPDLPAAEASRLAQRVLLDQLRFAGFPKADIAVREDGANLIVRIESADAKQIELARSVLTARRIAEFRLAADEDITDVWRESGVVPKGYQEHRWRARPAVDKEEEEPEPLLVRDRVEIPGWFVDSAVCMRLAAGSPDYMVEVRFTARGREAFRKVTRENVGLQLALLVDQEVVFAPVIREPVPGGVAQITGSQGQTENAKLAALLRAGRMPAGVDLVSEVRVETAKTGK
ncbi:MAG: hypothetical protein HZA54_03125 [Planctomycetes bacterium]|nr:hypothetical protein [Planctomycetota bacterium]